MFPTRHLNTKASKKRASGKKSSKKIKKKNEKENGHPGDNRAGVRIKETGDRNKEKDGKESC